MNDTINPTDFFVAGGTLKPTAPSYVTRPADAELLALAQKGKFCYVLTPRQMGKSSLMTRTARRLRERGVHAVSIDLTQSGAGVNVAQWYLSLLTQITRQLQIRRDAVAWWQERAALGEVQRFTDFLRDVVLAEVEGRVVIFIDEIDTTLKFDFRDDFFAAIRAIYNARAAEPEFVRLTFVLLGVAAPSDLIRDRARTPFNIGQAIALQEFSRADAAALRAELESRYPQRGAEIFNRIYHWTNGHPYLTQKLCLAAVETSEVFETSEVSNEVDKLVAREFLSDEARKESNLQFVQDRVLAYPRRRELLNLYKRVLAGQEVRDDGQSPLQNELKLAGLVKVEHDRLRVRNEIYRRVFDEKWAREHTQIDWARVVAGAAVCVAVLAIAAILYNAWVNNEVQNCYAQFHQTDDAAERVAHLARIVRLRGLFGRTDYDDEARELFYDLRRTEQLALFNADGVKGADVARVARALYLTLADVEGAGSTTPLLEAMADALERGGEQPDLLAEIDSWLRGQRSFAEGEYDAAVQEYNLAIELNGQNPATLYERARVLIALQEYEHALSDLDRVMALAQSAAAPEPTALPATMPGSAASGAAVTETLSLSTNTPGAAAAPTQIMAPADEVFPTPTTPPAPPTPTPTPAPLPTSDTFGSEFATFGQMRNAVRDLLYSDAALGDLLANVPETEYVSLRGIEPYAGEIRVIGGAEMVYVPAGEFIMGSSEEEIDFALQLCNESYGGCAREGFEDEAPQHRVYLDGFWIDRTEVTNAQYQECVDAGVCSETGWDNAAFNAPDQPVVMVSWDDAVAFCEWAGKRLPTEAEWEKAARGTDGRIFPWGDEFDGSRLNYCDANCEYDWKDEAYDDGYRYTAPVGSYPAGASPYGALDMAGNAWEWVADWYADDYYANSPARNPTGPVNGSAKVVRGGSWDYYDYSVRVANRFNYFPTRSDYGLGLRCLQ